MKASAAEAEWCPCGLEAYVLYGDEILCPFCFASRLRDRVRDGFEGDLDCMAALDRSEALLRMRKAEEELRLVSIVHGRTGRA